MTPRNASVALIGAGDFIGSAIAERFAAEGYLIYAGRRTADKLETLKAKIDAALQAGCRRFDGALKGIGGCPMAGNELVGNMDTEWMIPYFEELQLLPGIHEEALRESLRLATQIFV